MKIDRTYWDNKFAAYMHDPFDKVFYIPGHEERAAKLLDAFGFQKPNFEFYKRADVIASGFERGIVPGYSEDNSKNGAVNYQKFPLITHPISQNEKYNIHLPDYFRSQDESANATKVNEEIKDYILKTIGKSPGDGGYSNKDVFRNNHDLFIIGRFYYTHFALRFKLAEENVAKLGAFWHRIPADSRFPDHSIWQHNALTSALSSCMEQTGDVSNIGIMVFSIAPVQGFINKARRLRDYWTGSVLLSWLAFEGIRFVIENLGPDHILYPSLIDQPLVNEYLQKKWKIERAGSNKRKDVASLPNKFVFIIPFDKSEELAAEIKNCIKTEWKNLSKDTMEAFLKIAALKNDQKKVNIKEMFNRQVDNFWDFEWAASKLIGCNDKEEIEKFLPAQSFMDKYKLLEKFKYIHSVQKPKYNFAGEGILYSTSHELVQSALAAAKTKRKCLRKSEQGEKCHQCGEREVLQDEDCDGVSSARVYKDKIVNFWQAIKWPSEYDLKKNERLCALCLIKRIAYWIIGKNNKHILHAAFLKDEHFPSTTEIALTDYFERERITDAQKKRQIAQRIHEEKNGDTENRDRYYAILMMDGDKMGKLINGETLGATWESAMHPEIVSRLKDSSFDAVYHKTWDEIFKEIPKRIISPSIHAAISEALCDFSVYGVPDIIEKYKGQLIYAGGDDVCAMLPIGYAIEAAREIQCYYNHFFRLIDTDGKSTLINEWNGETGKLSCGLGDGDGISISAGILICHHKESLTEMIERAHGLLDSNAKDKCGRNACAVELKKRSGGSRNFARKWDDKEFWDALEWLINTIGCDDSVASRSFLYRMKLFRDGAGAILAEGNDELYANFIKIQLERNQKSNTDFIKEARYIAGITKVKDAEGKISFSPEVLIISAFIGKKEAAECSGSK